MAEIWGNNLTFDEGAVISDTAYIDAHLGSVHIGENSRILDGVKIWTHTHQWQPYTDDEIPNHLEIGKDCVICAYSMILPSCTKITDNVVIGAGAVVREDILEPGVYIGNPCVKLR